MTEEKVQEKLIECYQEAKTYLYPGHLTFRQRLFEQADELLMNCFEKNMKASKVECQTLIERLYQPVEMELFQTTCKDLEQQLIQFKRSIQLILKEYNTEAQGPMKERISAEFIQEKLVQSLVEWGIAVSNEHRNSKLNRQKDSNQMRQEINAIQGKTKALQEVLLNQKESYERALKHATERLSNERVALRNDIESKETEINRVNQQIKKMRGLQKEALERLDLQLQEANAQVERLDGLTNAEREPGRFVFDFLERMHLNGSTYHHHAVGFLQQCITALGEVDISKVPSRRVG